MKQSMLGDFRRRNLERIRSTKLVRDVMAGEPDRNMYLGYLVTVYQYAQHSPSVIALAASRCTSTAPRLAEYLLHHASEELGHEAWARQDLLELGVADGTFQRSRPVPSCSAMIGFEYWLAGHANPVSLFGWLFALESLGDDAASAISKAFDSGLKLDGKGTYFLRGHGEADHCHARDLVARIVENVPNEADFAEILHAADVSSILYARMLEDIAALEHRWV